MAIEGWSCAAGFAAAPAVGALRLPGVTVPGVKVSGVKVSGVKLFVVKVTGAMVTGVEISGLTFNGVTGTGVTDIGVMETGVKLSGLTNGAGVAVCEALNSVAAPRVATGVVVSGSAESVGRTSEFTPAVKVTGDDTTAFGRTGTGATAVAVSTIATNCSAGRTISGAIATMGVLTNDWRSVD